MRCRGSVSSMSLAQYLCHNEKSTKAGLRDAVITSAKGVRSLRVVQYPESHHVPTLLGSAL